MKGRIKSFINRLPYVRELYQQVQEFGKNSSYPAGHYYSPIVSVEDIKKRQDQIWKKENNDNILMFGDYSIDLKQRVDYDQINQDLQNVKQNDIVNILTKEHDKYTERQSIRYQGVKLTTLL